MLHASGQLASATILPLSTRQGKPQISQSPTHFPFIALTRHFLGHTFQLPQPLPRSTCKITNLTITSQGAGGCILHHGGQLHLERLHLRCSIPDGLAHLCAPVVTTAGGFGSGMGRLSVECTMAGGEKAVACRGAGALRAVRAVYQV